MVNDYGEIKMKDLKYWKKEIEEMHPTEYLDLMRAINKVSRNKEKMRTITVDGKIKILKMKEGK